MGTHMYAALRILRADRSTVQNELGYMNDIRMLERSTIRTTCISMRVIDQTHSSINIDRTIEEQLHLLCSRQAMRPDLALATNSC